MFWKLTLIGLKIVAESVNGVSAMTDSINPASRRACPIAIACTLK